MSASTKTVKIVEKGREKLQRKKYFAPKPSTVLLLRPEEEQLVKEFYEKPWELIAEKKKKYTPAKDGSLEEDFIHEEEYKKLKTLHKMCKDAFEKVKSAVKHRKAICSDKNLQGLKAIKNARDRLRDNDDTAWDIQEYDDENLQERPPTLNKVITSAKCLLTIKMDK